MAFLCPSRRSRQKKKKKEDKEPYLGRITGSASVDTLVRVGLEKQHGLTPEARMTVVDDFIAGAADELNVARDQTVYMLYTEQEWMYVLMEDGREGFIPRSFAKPSRSPAMHKRVPPTPLSQIRGRLPSPVGGTDDEGNDGDQSNSPTNSSSQVGGFPDASLPEDDGHRAPSLASEDGPQQGSVSTSEQEGDMYTLADIDLPDVFPFAKREQGKWVTMFAYDAQHENDVSVTAGEVLAMLNCDDKAWCWVRRSEGEQGFVPQAFLCRLPDDLRVTNKTAVTGLPPVAQKGSSKGHQRSQSLTDQPQTGLPHYLRHSAARRPVPAAPSKPVLSMEPFAGSYSVTRAAASSAARHRPHSSIGSPTTFSSVPSSSSSSSSAPVAGQTPPPLPHKPTNTSHSPLGSPLISSLSQSQSSLPLAVASEETPSISRTTNQRPHSSLGNPIVSSENQTWKSSTHSKTSSHGIHQRPHSSLGHPIVSAWNQNDGDLFSGASGSDLPVYPSKSNVPASHSTFEPLVSNNGKNSRSDQNSPPRRFHPSNHRPPPLPGGPAFHSSSRGSQSSSSYSPSHSSPANHVSPLSHHSTNQAQSFSPGHSPSANQNSPSLTTRNRFMNSHSRGRSNTPPRLSSSLNQSQDGRRPILMHQNSAPEMTVQPQQFPPNTSSTSQGANHTYEPYRFQTDMRSKPPMFGDTGRSKSSPHFPGVSPTSTDVTELMTLRKFASKEPDDISVSSGEIVYGDLSRQPEKDWVWVYSPKMDKHGYLPRSNVRLPASGGDLRSETVARV